MGKREAKRKLHARRGVVHSGEKGGQYVIRRSKTGKTYRKYL